MVHDRDPLAELVGLLHVVRGEQDRLALAVQLAEQVPQREPALRVQPGGGLVEEQHARAVEDGPGHHEPLGHAAGQGVDRRLGPPAELELLEQLVGGLPGGLGAHAEQPAVEVQVLPDGELAVQGVLLGDDPAELLGQRGVGRDVDAGDERPAGGRDHAGGEDAGRGGLACAVRAEEAEDLPGFHVEVELVHRGEVGARVDLGQVLGVDDGIRLVFPGPAVLARRNLCSTHIGIQRSVGQTWPGHRRSAARPRWASARRARGETKP